MRKQRCDEACLSRIHFFDWSADAKVQTQKSLEATAAITAFVVGSLPSAPAIGTIGNWPQPSGQKCVAQSPQKPERKRGRPAKPRVLSRI
jgi:hypothetical protein